MSTFTPSPLTRSDKPPDLSRDFSTEDKKVNATMYLKELSARMVDVSTELKRIHETFSSSDSLTRDQKSLLKSLKQTIIPFIDESSTQLVDASKVVAPISGLDYVHKRDEVKRKRDLRDDDIHTKCSRKSSPLKRIEHITHKHPLSSTVVPKT